MGSKPPLPTPTLASPFTFFLRVTSSFNPHKGSSPTGYSTIEIFFRTIMPVMIIFLSLSTAVKGGQLPTGAKEILN